MSIRVMTIVWDLPLPDSEKLVLLALADCANDEGCCWPSITTLMRKCSKSDRTIQGAIKRLVEAGHLSRHEVPGKGCNYTVHPRTNFTPENASPPKPVRDTPEAASGKPSRTTISSEAKASSDSARRRKPDPFPIPDGVDPTDWEALKANRNRKRAALSEGAHRQIVAKLERWTRDGWLPGPIVAHAAERGWATVFETDEMKRGPNGTGNRNQGSGRYDSEFRDPVLADIAFGVRS